MNKHSPLMIMILWAIFFLDLPSAKGADNPSFDDLRKKRDPFVALVNSNGKIKSEEELFQKSERTPLTTDVSLKAIIWDDQRPLVLINKKVYAQGDSIEQGLVVEKITPNSVTLNNKGTLVTIQLRKTEKQWIK